MSQDTRFTENFSRKRLFVVISDSRECAQWIEHGEKHGYGYFQLVWVRLTIREKRWSKSIHLDRTKRVLSFERVKPCCRVSHIACYEESWESQKFFFWCFAISGGIGKSYANGLLYKTRYLRDGSNLTYPSDGWKGRFCHNLSIASLCGVDHPSTVFWWNIDSFSGYGSLYFSRPFFVKESMIRRNSFSDVKWSVDLEKTLFEVGHHWRNRWKSRKMTFFCHREKKYH